MIDSWSGVVIKLKKLNVYCSLVVKLVLPFSRFEHFVCHLFRSCACCASGICNSPVCKFAEHVYLRLAETMVASGRGKHEVLNICFICGCSGLVMTQTFLRQLKIFWPHPPGKKPEKICSHSLRFVSLCSSNPFLTVIFITISCKVLFSGFVPLLECSLNQILTFKGAWKVLEMPLKFTVFLKLLEYSLNSLFR